MQLISKPTAKDKYKIAICLVINPWIKEEIKIFKNSKWTIFLKLFWNSGIQLKTISKKFVAIDAYFGREKMSKDSLKAGKEN